jgi:hypothetical protein
MSKSFNWLFVYCMVLQYLNSLIVNRHLHFVFVYIFMYIKPSLLSNIQISNQPTSLYLWRTSRQMANVSGKQLTIAAKGIIICVGFFYYVKWWSIISPMSTKRTINSYFNSLSRKKVQHIWHLISSSWLGTSTNKWWG